MANYVDIKYNFTIGSGATTGAMVLIKSITASSSSTVSFVDGSSDVVLDNTYPLYKFEFINLHPSHDNLDLQFNGSADTGSNYNVTKTTSFFRTEHDEGDTGTELAYKTGRDVAQVLVLQPLLVDLAMIMTKQLQAIYIYLIHHPLHL